MISRASLALIPISRGRISTRFERPPDGKGLLLAQQL